MTDSGNGQPLLGGSGGEQGAGTAEKDAFEFSDIQLIQKIAAEGNGAAAAAGSSCVDILGGVVENQRAAICQFSAQQQPMAPAHFQQEFLAQLSQVTGNDQVEIFRNPVQILHVSPDGLKCSRCHSSPHIAGICNAKIRHGADGAAFYSGPCTRGTDQCSAGSGDSPLGGGGALPAITEGEPVLPFGGCEMGGCLGHNLVRKTAAYHHGCGQQAFCHGGTGTIKAKVWNILIAQAERRADALVQQISGKHQVEVGLFHAGLFCQLLQRQLLAALFGLLPGFLAEKGVLGGDVECVGQGSFRLFFARHTGPCPDDRKLGKGETLLSLFVWCHERTFFAVFVSMYPSGDIMKT